MSISGNGVNAYLRNMDYRNRMHGNTGDISNKEFGKNKESQETLQSKTTNLNPNIKKVEDKNEILKLDKKLPPHGIGSLMDFKV